MVIVEYCKYGNVQNILRINRHQFIDQINRVEDMIDPNISERRTEVEDSSDLIVQNTNIVMSKIQSNQVVQKNGSNVSEGNFDLI